MRYKAGADGIMIHSKSSEADEVLFFAKEYKKFSEGQPLVVVPTMYLMFYKTGLRIERYRHHQKIKNEISF